MLTICLCFTFGLCHWGKAQDSHTLSHGDTDSFCTSCLLMSQTTACPFAFVRYELTIRLQLDVLS